MHALGITELCVTLATLLTLLALLGMMRWASRVRADRRLRAVLDRYAELEATRRIIDQMSVDGSGR